MIQSQIPERSISVVTVTYADRLAFLEVVARKCFEDPLIADIYIVSNASKSNLQSLKDEWGKRIKLIKLDRNYGSAIGYKKGIAAALEGGSPYLMLLDDDNPPAPGCMSALAAELQKLSNTTGPALSAVAAPRDFHRPEVLAGASPEALYSRPSGFMGFNLFHKLVRKRIMNLLGTDRIKDGATSVTVPMGPYGGILASRSLYKKVGLPEERLILYSDDIEYTYRITQLGGKIKLVFGARVEDIDSRHSIDMDEATVFGRILKSGSHFRLYYMIRNQIWFERHRRADSLIAYNINRFVFLFFMRRAARRLGYPETYKIFLDAVRDGEAENLGENKEFPLP